MLAGVRRACASGRRRLTVRTGPPPLTKKCIHRVSRFFVHMFKSEPLERLQHFGRPPTLEVTPLQLAEFGRPPDRGPLPRPRPFCGMSAAAPRTANSLITSLCNLARLDLPPSSPSRPFSGISPAPRKWPILGVTPHASWSILAPRAHFLDMFQLLTPAPASSTSKRGQRRLPGPGGPCVRHWPVAKMTVSILALWQLCVCVCVSCHLGEPRAQGHRPGLACPPRVRSSPHTVDGCSARV